MLPMKLPVKSAIGPVHLKHPVRLFAQGPTPTTSNVEPVLAKVPPLQMLPLVRAPVEKVTEPRLCPEGALIKKKLTNWDPLDTVPLAVMLTVPNLLRISGSAQADMGNSSAQSASIPAIRLMVSSTERKPPFKTTRDAGSYQGIAAIPYSLQSPTPS